MNKDTGSAFKWPKKTVALHGCLCRDNQKAKAGSEPRSVPARLIMACNIE